MPLKKQKKNAMPWKTIKEEEPKDSEEVLVIEASSDIGPPLTWIGEYIKNEKCFHIVGGGFLKNNNVDYWMNIPAKPKKEKE